MPHWFILDETFRVKLARPGAGNDPLNRFYTPECRIDALPNRIETAVRELTAHWGEAHIEPCATTTVDELVISVAPLHGPQGRHIGVFVEQAS